MPCCLRVIILAVIGGITCVDSSAESWKDGVVAWAQDRDWVFATIRVRQMKDHKVTIAEEGFKFWATQEDMPRVIDFSVNLLKSINVSASSYKELPGKGVDMRLRKVEANGLFWPRIQKEEKRPKHIVVDWTRWDEDLEEKLEDEKNDKSTQHASGSTINMDDIKTSPMPPPPGFPGGEKVDPEVVKKQQEEQYHTMEKLWKKYPEMPRDLNFAGVGLTDKEMDTVAKALANDPDRHARSAAELTGNKEVPQMKVPTVDEQIQKLNEMPDGPEKDAGWEALERMAQQTGMEIPTRPSSTARRSGSRPDTGRDGDDTEESAANDPNHIEL